MKKTGWICVRCGKLNATEGSFKHPYCKRCFKKVWDNNDIAYLKWLTLTHSFGTPPKKEKILQKIRRFMSELRYEEVKKWLIGRTLDVGAEFYYSYFTKQCDLIKKERIEYQDILNLTYSDNEFDTVVCLETLEHTLDPVRAIKELKRVAKKRIIISVPNEPWFSLSRLSWNKEHLWAITPKVLKHYLGKTFSR